METSTKYVNFCSMIYVFEVHSEQDTVVKFKNILLQNVSNALNFSTGS